MQTSLMLHESNSITMLPLIVDHVIVDLNLNVESCTDRHTLYSRTVGYMIVDLNLNVESCMDRQYSRCQIL